MPVEILCLSANFEIYFTQIISSCKLLIHSNMDKWKFIIKIGMFTAQFRLGTWFIIICNLYSYYLQYRIIQCNVSNSDEQKYILQMSAIDVYV